MSTTTREPGSRPATLGALLALVVAVVTAGVGTTIVALLGRAAGAPADFKPLQPGAYLSFTVVGVLAGLVGWLLIRRTAHARRTLRVLVPLVVVLSWIPDVALGVTQGQPGTTWTGVVALIVMHPVVAACAVGAFARFLPVPPEAR